jgi:23S rRNA (cytidine1920-2'-O)/16S rRNA (cytidine1409-2'-O)-methyltransferase
VAKERLDAALVARGLCADLDRARRLILAGEVRVDGHVCDKASTVIGGAAEIEVRGRPRFVGRGGVKLERALEVFGINPAGRVCLDVGASTGGFTDCLLQRGAARVHAFDAGKNQLAWKLRNDPRVVVRERFNVRHLVPGDVGEPVGLVVIDVSFISLTRMLGPAFSVLEAGGAVVCLIKPQFELPRRDVGKGGLVRDPALHERAMEKIRDFVTGGLAKEWRGQIESPITGTDGNREFLAWLTHPHA